MIRYRMAVPASICVDVDAENEQQAKQLAASWAEDELHDGYEMLGLPSGTCVYPFPQGTSKDDVTVEDVDEFPPSKYHPNQLTSAFGCAETQWIAQAIIRYLVAHGDSWDRTFDLAEVMELESPASDCPLLWLLNHQHSSTPNDYWCTSIWPYLTGPDTLGANKWKVNEEFKVRLRDSEDAED